MQSGEVGARELIAGTRLLPAHQPTGNLHSQEGEEIMRLFRRIDEQGTTIVPVTHSRNGWLERS